MNAQPKTPGDRLAGLLIAIGALMPWLAVTTGLIIAVYRIQNPGAGISQDTALLGVWIFVGMMLLGETGHSLRNRHQKRSTAAQETHLAPNLPARPAQQRPDEDEDGNYIPLLPPAEQTTPTPEHRHSRFAR